MSEMMKSQLTISNELHNFGFQFLDIVEVPQYFYPVALHNCDENSYILVNDIGSINVVNKDLSEATVFPQTLINFLEKKKWM